MPIPIQDVGVSTAMAEAYGLKGKVSLQHDEVIVGVTIVRDLTKEVAAAEAGGPIIVGCAGGGTTAAFATDTEEVFAGLRNPVSSGVLVTVELFRWRYQALTVRSGTSQPELTVMDVTLGNPYGVRSFRDLRQLTSLPGAFLVTDEVAPAAFAAAAIADVYAMENFSINPFLAGGPFQPNKPGPEGYWEDDNSYIIAPGQQLVIHDRAPLLVADVVGLTQWWWWTEQPVVS